jgi:hypothetical protein
LQARLPEPSDLVIDLGGTYDYDTRTGAIEITIDNEGAEPLTGTLQCILTESELYYEAPNDLDWHHHVMRDMIPTETGTAVTIEPGTRTLISHNFLIDPTWDPTECELICFVQSDLFAADSTRDIWQGAKVAVTEITGTSDIAQHPSSAAVDGAPCVLHASRPNPAHGASQITFELARPEHVRLALFDATGRRLLTLFDGERAAGPHAATWRGVDASGDPVPAGVYFYRLTAGAFSQTRQLLIAR